MAIKTGGKHLSEAELNAPDLDDDGNPDVSYYPIPEFIHSGNAYFDEVWRLAAGALNARES